jgi:hypothetical protein
MVQLFRRGIKTPRTGNVKHALVLQFPCNLSIPGAAFTLSYRLAGHRFINDELLLKCNGSLIEVLLNYYRKNVRTCKSVKSVVLFNKFVELFVLTFNVCVVSPCL